MLRKLALILALFAVAVSPVAAQYYRDTPKPTKDLSYLDYSSPPISQPSDSKFLWLGPALKMMTSVFFLFGAVPGIIASKKGMPGWKKTLWRGLLFGFLFFPVVFYILYKVLKYESQWGMEGTNQGAFRPLNGTQNSGPPPPEVEVT